jgi:hypothetical protein
VLARAPRATPGLSGLLVASALRCFGGALRGLALPPLLPWSVLQARKRSEAKATGASWRLTAQGNGAPVLGLWETWWPCRGNECAHGVTLS